MLTLSRLRPRRRVPYWLVAGAVALVTAAVVGRLAGDAAAERARWGDARITVVTTAAVPAGERLTGHVATRRLPTALVPHDALVAVPDGAVAAVDLAPGEVVLPTRLAGAGRSTVAARLPAGTRGVAVPTGNGLPVALGDHVDVLATFDPKDSAGEPTVTVAHDALVVAVGKDAVTVAVATAAAPRVAYALATGTVTLVLSG